MFTLPPYSMKQLCVLLWGAFLAVAPVRALVYQIDVVGEFRTDPSSVPNLYYAAGTAIVAATNLDWQQSFYQRIVNNRTFGFSVQFDPTAVPTVSVGQHNYIAATLVASDYFVESATPFDFAAWTVGVRFLDPAQQQFEILLDRRIDYGFMGRYQAASIFLISDVLSDRGDFRIHGTVATGHGVQGARPTSIDFHLAVIPEPSTAAIVLGSVVAVAVVLRRRRGER